MIGIVDLGRGNIGSVKNALDFLGASSVVLGSPLEVEKCSKIVLPGVGSFFNSMGVMKARGFDEALRDFAARGRLLLGICLGMQLLASQGTENGDIEGLGLVPGRVRKMNLPEGFRLPHVGWNGVTSHGEHPLFRGVKAGVDFYFTHSYVFDPARESHSIGKTLYGEHFTSAVASGNVWGVQFHPEKSQKNGLRILKNFLEEEVQTC